MSATDVGAPLREFVQRVQGGKPLVLLAGAGISATAGVGTGEYLATQLQTEYPRAFRRQESFSYSEVFRKAIPLAEDRRARIESECMGCLPKAEHHWIAQFIKHRYLRAVVTTNFDHLIEFSLMQMGCKGIPVVLNEDELHPGLWHPGIPLIVKIHGDFLFNDIANLAEELQSKLRENMRHALIEMTKGADLLVVGYSGSDETVMSLIGEMVRGRLPDATRVWWSLYRYEEPAETSPLGQLVTTAEKSLNPIMWLGPWPASECLRSLGSALGVPAPAPVPFGITGATITFPTHFSHPIQRLAGSQEVRSTTIAAHRRLMEWVEQDSVILVHQELGAGGSTLLSAIAETAGKRGLYYDPQFGLLPRHLDLRCHLGALALQLGVESVFSQLFICGAVIVVDGVEVRSPKLIAYMDEDFLATIRDLARAQLKAGKGTLVIGTHLSPAELQTLRRMEVWLPKEDRTYRLHMGACLLNIPSSEAERLLDVLGLAATAIPERVAVHAAGLSSPFNWRSLEPWVERRGGRVTLREPAHRERRGRLRGEHALARKLADALVEELDDVHPLRTVGLALEAEALYFRPGEPTLEALSLFLRVAESGLSHPVTRHYFQATLVDHLKQGINIPRLWRKLPGPMAEILARVAVKMWCDAGMPPSKDGLWGRTLNALLLGRNYVDRELIELPLRLRHQVHEASNAQTASEKLCEILPSLEQTHCRAHKARMFVASRARLALSISAIWDTVGDQTMTSSAYESGLKWTRRAKRDAVRARDRGTAGLASDNEVLALLKLGRLDDAERTLKKRLAELGKRQGFSAGKAVTFGNLFHLALKRGLIEKAEAHFFEAVLQCVVLQRWHGLHANLELLGCFAKKEPRLPKPELIAATKMAVAAVHPIWPF